MTDSSTRTRPVRIHRPRQAKPITSADLIRQAAKALDQAHGWITRAQTTLQCTDETVAYTDQIESVRTQVNGLVLVLRELSGVKA